MTTFYADVSVTRLRPRRWSPRRRTERQPGATWRSTPRRATMSALSGWNYTLTRRWTPRAATHRPCSIWTRAN